MKHKIETAPSGTVEIHVDATDAEQPALLKNLQDCQSGQCGCPSREYDKIERMSVDADARGIHIRLKPKTNRKIDTRKVETCLAWSAQTSRSED